MKRFSITFCFAIIFLGIGNAQEITTSNAAKENNPPIRTKARFTDCAENEQNLLACNSKKMLQLIYANFKMPRMAKLRKLERDVRVKYKVDKTGKIVNVAIKDDSGLGVERAFVEAFEQLPLMIPATYNGEPVESKSHTLFLRVTQNPEFDPEMLVNNFSTPIDIDPVFKVVEDMPLFPGCEAVEEKRERKVCAQKKMLEFIYGNIKMPNEVPRGDFSGTVVVSFIVSEAGKIMEPVLLRDIGYGCGAEALKIVQQMPDWTPGMQRGKAVNVRFNLPIKFRR